MLMLVVEEVKYKFMLEGFINVDFQCIFISGGASDVRTVAGDLSSRLFVAGGGGGGGAWSECYGGFGGLVGQNAASGGTYGGRGGTASAGGIGGTDAGSVGHLPLPGAGSLGTGGLGGYQGGKHAL